MCLFKPLIWRQLLFSGIKTSIKIVEETNLHLYLNGVSMLFMVVEHFENNDMVPVYERFRMQGRMSQDGLKYVGSWIEASFSRCFQLMDCEDPRLLQNWVLQWRGTGIRFEFFPVVSSDQTREVVAPYLADDK